MATNKMSTVEEEEIDLLALAKYLFPFAVSFFRDHLHRRFSGCFDARLLERVFGNFPAGRADRIGVCGLSDRYAQ